MLSPSDPTDQLAVIAFLGNPTAYGIDGPVERIDTHAAIIFLADDRAYKLKRAVRYSYLDFSTREKRRAVCQAELTLNRRTAPELYLEVRSVNRTADGSLGFGPGQPVDWVVVMRRFAPNDLLETVARHGGLSDALVRDLADEIARFHDNAAIVNGGASARLHDVIIGNAESMRAATALPQGLCQNLLKQSIAEWRRVAQLLERRADEGHVRHCHGDLHLANVCLWRGKPTLFDCLEFDTELATTDVLYDLAFLLMDLWQRGCRSQASLLFNRYLDMRDEGGGIAALPLFLSARAAVRAHVSASAAGRQHTEQLREDKRNLAKDYLDAAIGFLEQPAPRLITVGGLSGSGKSTIASMLAPTVGAAPGARWLRTDVLRKRLAGVAPEVRLSSSAYTPQASAEVYKRLLGEASAMLAAGRSVIVDGVFADPAERAAIAAVADGAGVPFTGLWLTAPPDVLMSRVEARRSDASDADGRVVARQLEYDIGDLGEWIVVDAGRPARTVIAAVQDRLA